MILILYKLKGAGTFQQSLPKHNSPVSGYVTMIL